MAQAHLPPPEDAVARDPGRRTERVATGTLLAWAPPIFGIASSLFLVQFFFLKFATDVLLLPPLAVGLIFASGRVWDAVSDPIVGTWSDRTHTRLGRRRPWMFAGIPLLLVSLIMLWSPPDWAPVALAAWVAVALFSFYTAFTMYMVPHQALGAELSTDHHDRSRIFGAQSACFTLGMMMAFPAMQWITNAEDPRGTASTMIFGAVGLIGLILLIPPLFLRERPEYQGRGSASSFAAMRDVLRSPHARLLLIAQFIQMFGAGVLGIMAPYLVEYVVKRPDLIGPLPAIFVFFNVLSIPVWIRVSRSRGKRNTWVIGMIGTGIAFGLVGFVQENEIVLMGFLLFLAGCFAGCGAVMGPSILVDVIDADEHATDQRKEGAYMAAWGFAIKSSNALVILVASAALQFSDFTPNQDQTPGTIMMLRVLNAGLPFCMFLLGAAVFRRFAFNEGEHALVRAELDRRSGTA